MNEHNGLSMRAIALALLASASASAEVVVVPAGVTPGPLNVSAATTLQMPPDGKFYYTTITVSAPLFFTKNALNTPVYLLATGNVVVNNTISVRGAHASVSPPVGAAGGPGGFDGGDPAFGSIPSGAGHGPGGAPPNGQGSHLTGALAYGTPLLLPLVGGSGGGGGTSPGGGGGGAIVIASNGTISINANPSVDAIGGAGSSSGGGSGGSVRLVAPRVDGAGFLYVFGNNGSASSGRCRVDTIDRRGLAVGCHFSSPLVVGAMMQVEPDTMPRLDILKVANFDVPGGSLFNVTLPAGTPSPQPVRIRAQSFFSGSALVRVRVTPSSGTATLLDPFVLSNNTPLDIDVPLPANNAVTIEVYGEEGGGG